MNNFSHLHVHSYYSINDGLASLEDLSSFDYLKHITEYELSNRYGNNVPSIAVERLSYELGIVREKGCADYFLHYFELASLLSTKSGRVYKF